MFGSGGVELTSEVLGRVLWIYSGDDATKTRDAMENDGIFYNIWKIHGKDVSLLKSSFVQGRTKSASLVFYLIKREGSSRNGVNLSFKEKNKQTAR